MTSPVSADTRGRFIPLIVSVCRRTRDVSMDRTIVFYTSTREDSTLLKILKFLLQLLVQRTISILTQSFSYVRFFFLQKLGYQVLILNRGHLSLISRTMYVNKVERSSRVHYRTNVARAWVNAQFIVQTIRFILNHNNFISLYGHVQVTRTKLFAIQFCVIEKEMEMMAPVLHECYVFDRFYTWLCRAIFTFQFPVRTDVTVYAFSPLYFS